MRTHFGEKTYLSRLMRKGFLSHLRQRRLQTSLRIRTVSPEPSPLSQTILKWATARQNLQSGLCAQRRQISLDIRPDWSESLLSARRKLVSLATHWAHIVDSDQTGRMPRLIWDFAGRTGHFVDLFMHWFNSRRDFRQATTSPSPFSGCPCSFEEIQRFLFSPDGLFFHFSSTSPTGSYGNCVRLSISFCDRDKLGEGARRFCRALNDTLTASSW